VLLRIRSMYFFSIHHFDSSFRFILSIYPFDFMPMIFPLTHLREQFRTLGSMTFAALVAVLVTALVTALVTVLVTALIAVAPAVAPAVAQVEHVPLAHPIYPLLMRWEAQKFLGANFSSTALPLQRKEIMAALVSARQHDSLLSDQDRSLLVGFEQEFRVRPAGFSAEGNAVRSTVFSSYTDSTQVLFSRLLSNDEKSLFVIADSNLSVNVVPLANIDYRMSNFTVTDRLAPVITPDQPANASERYQTLSGLIGGRLYGTLSNTLGFFLQATNARSALGRSLNTSSGLGALASVMPLLADPFLYQTFAVRIASDQFFDYADSHLRFEKDWFYAVLGRESRLIGSGYNTRLVLSNNAAPFDALTLGARFGGFEYRFMQGSRAKSALASPSFTLGAAWT
jgi:hypothetical protein